MIDALNYRLKDHGEVDFARLSDVELEAIESAAKAWRDKAAKAKSEPRIVLKRVKVKRGTSESSKRVV